MTWCKPVGPHVPNASPTGTAPWRPARSSPGPAPARGLAGHWDFSAPASEAAALS